MPLFDKIEESTAQKLKEKFAGKQSSAPVTAEADKTKLQEQLDKQVRASMSTPNQDSSLKCMLQGLRT